MLRQKSVKHVASSKCFFNDCNGKEGVYYHIITIPQWKLCAVENRSTQKWDGPRIELSTINTEPIAISNGNKAMLQSTLLTEPVLLNPTLEKISSRDRRFSHKAKKITRKTRSIP